MDKLAVITAVHADTQDKIDWLGETIASVQSQTFQDWEMIVIDDSSPLLLDRVKVSDERVRFARTVEHAGPARARNTGVSAARAEAIIVLDADDRFAHNDILTRLYDEWQKDKSKFIYGTVTVYEEGKPNREIKLPQYRFENTFRELGCIPVTALHAKSAWERIGGWSAQFDGLEDVEYWIRAGELGICGKNIGEPIIIYRRHSDSRTARIPNQGAVRDEIRELHIDLYEGRYPVGCCGGSRRSSPPQVAPANQGMMAMASSGPTKISDELKRMVGTKGIPVDVIWMKYNGRRTGTWGVKGKSTGVDYMIEGPGHEREIFAVDARQIARLGRGKDFSVGISPPMVEEPEPEPIEKPPERKPDMVMIVREPQPVEPQPVELGSINDLMIKANLRNALVEDGWTIEALAVADEEDLTKIKGIGPVTAKTIIEEAQWLII